MTIRSIWSSKLEVIRYVRGTCSHVCLWDILPLFSQPNTILSNNFPKWQAANVEPGGTDYDIEFFNGRWGRDAGRVYLVDLAQLNPNVVLLKGF